jgi:hypothetical protein
MKGPSASVALRLKSDFLKEVLGSPAQTALGSTSPWKDLSITVVKLGIDRKVQRTRAKNFKVTRTKYHFLAKNGAIRGVGCGYA